MLSTLRSSAVDGVPNVLCAPVSSDRPISSFDPIPWLLGTSRTSEQSSVRCFFRVVVTYQRGHVDGQGYQRLAMHLFSNVDRRL